MAKIKPPLDSGVHKKEYFPLKCDSKDSFHLQTANNTTIDMSKVSRKEPNATKCGDLKVFIGLVLYFLKKCWMSCSAAVFVVFVIYWCYGGLIAFILFMFALSAFLFQVGDFFLYHPDQPPQSRLYVPLPSLFGLPGDSIFLKTEDGVKIHAFFIKQDPSIVGQVPTILYFHGNAGNIGHRLPNAQGLYKYCKCNILLLEYRGYGHSDGTPSEEGLYLDAQAGMKYLLDVPYIDKGKIIVFGRSLGGAVAIDLLTHPQYAKHVLVLIVENTFTSIPDVAKAMFSSKLIDYLPTWTFKNQFLSLKKIKTVKRPSLFISGRADAIIPPRMMKKLLEISGSPIKRFQSYKYGTHNETWQCQGYYIGINMFIDDVLLAQREMEQWPTMFEDDGAEIY
ncbi:hypothetical protein TNIN_479521 [Trichonephila inaurata madagascariensis]|uniref:Abhydrolase domain-containing protein 13 n=1 Tax=Trichonephila inaurata madagascariensis TaxID=2747483 RepID=A0A8X6Y6S1_9ARAC|nr:hypothetical protein TNIN_479521 [Trichonephila inaurata madagascariensis]